MEIDLDRTASLIDLLSAASQQIPRANWLHDDIAPGAQSFIEAFNQCASTLARRGTELCEHAAELSEDSRRNLADIDQSDQTLGQQFSGLEGHFREAEDGHS